MHTEILYYSKKLCKKYVVKKNQDDQKRWYLYLMSHENRISKETRTKHYLHGPEMEWNDIVHQKQVQICVLLKTSFKGCQLQDTSNDTMLSYQDVHM